MQSLRFQAGGRTLALDLRWIREVCPVVHLQSLPSAPPWLRGLFDFHGQLLPVVDAGALLGGTPVEPRLGARILLLHGAMSEDPGASRATFGLMVEAVDGLLMLDRTDAWTAREGLPELPFLREALRQPDGAVMLLDPARLASMHAALLEGPALLPAAVAPGPGT